MKRSQITIKDIARILDVAPSTVSRALQGHYSISSEMKAAVLKLAREMNYQPNSIARSLVSSKTNTIGVVIPKIVHHVFSSVISGIDEIVYPEGYNILICQTNESYEREVEIIEALVSSRVDGILISISKNTNRFDHLAQLKKRVVPLVLFDRICTEIQAASVVADDYTGALKATEHLIFSGCKRIAHLAGPQNLKICRNRLEGYMEAHRRNGLIVDPDIVLNSELDRDIGSICAKHLMEMDNPPDGFFAVCDSVAIGAMLTVQKMGFKVPEEVAFIGYNNALGTMDVVPNLSTIEQPSREMGMAAANLFLAQINKGATEICETNEITLDTKLIIRESTLHFRGHEQKVKSKASR